MNKTERDYNFLLLYMPLHAHADPGTCPCLIIAELARQKSKVTIVCASQEFWSLARQGLCYHRLVWGLEKRGSLTGSASCQDSKPKEAGEAETTERACSPAQCLESHGGAMFIHSFLLLIVSYSHASIFQVFLLDGKCKQPIYSGPCGIAITPVINLQQDAHDLLHTALHKTQI